VRPCPFALALALLLCVASPAAAAPWSESFPRVRADVRGGKPFVALVVVPLCSNAQIDCGSGVAGRPGDLRTNLYWGAVFGARRFFDRPRSGWERVAEAKGDGALERVVYRRLVPASAWGAQGSSIEQLVVLEAIHGDRIDDAVARLGHVAGEGARVRFRDGDRERDEAVHVVGYAGHNRIFDGTPMPPPPADTARAIPSFVLACYSEAYFAEPLRAAGSLPLVTTRAYMAPEGYAVEATVRALGDDLPAAGVRDAVVRAYAKWQGLPWRVASPMFAPAAALGGAAPGR
jgi:hypothetical protein